MPGVERPELLLICGVAGIAGGLALVLLQQIALARAPDHDAVADTISALAKGPTAWIMDLGFYTQAAGAIGLSIGAAHFHPGRWGWSVGVLTLALIALVVTLLGVYDDFHGHPVPPEAYTVHTRLTFLLGPLYVIGPLAMAQGAARVSWLYRALFIASGLGSGALGLAFFLVPDHIDGLMERLSTLAGLAWLLALGVMLLRRGVALRSPAVR